MIFVLSIPDSYVLQMKGSRNPIEEIALAHVNSERRECSLDSVRAKARSVDYAQPLCTKILIKTYRIKLEMNVLQKGKYIYYCITIEYDHIRESIPMFYQILLFIFPFEFNTIEFDANRPFLYSLM